MLIQTTALIFCVQLLCWFLDAGCLFPIDQQFKWCSLLWPAAVSEQFKVCLSVVHDDGRPAGITSSFSSLPIFAPLLKKKQKKQKQKKPDARQKKKIKAPGEILSAVFLNLTNPFLRADYTTEQMTSLQMQSPSPSTSKQVSISSICQ